jgi:hypothetical protein
MAEPTKDGDTVTISKQEYATLTGTFNLLDAAWKNKENGSAFRRALKAANPAARIPEEDADAVAAPVLSELEKLKEENKKLLERMDAKDKAETDGKVEADMRAAIAQVRKDYNFDDEGMEKVFARMREKQNPDVEAAAAYIAKTLPKPQTVKEPGFAPQLADTKTVFGAADGDDADMALLHSGRPWDFFDKTAAKILNEPSGQQAA